MAATITMIAPATRIIMPMVRLVFGALAASDVWAGVGVKVLRLPAGRGVLVTGAAGDASVGVRDGRGVSERIPVTVGLGVRVGVSDGVGVWVTVAVRLGVGLGVGG